MRLIICPLCGKVHAMSFNREFACDFMGRSIWYQYDQSYKTYTLIEPHQPQELPHINDYSLVNKRKPGEINGK